MDYAIRTLTQRWTERLTELAGEREFLTMAEVAGAGASGGSGLPIALVARVQQILMHQFRVSMDSPVTEWAELDRPEVAEAWRAFLAVVEHELRLPVAYVPAVVETAVADVLEMVLQPRVAIPQALFGDQESKTLEKLREAADLVVVNGQLAYAVVRYMERQGLAELSLNKAAELVQRVDEKLLEGHSDEQIMELLEPFFELFEGDGDPAMLCLFFEDKEMMDVVRRLEEERSAVDRVSLLDLMRVAREDAERGAGVLAFVGLNEELEGAVEAEQALVEGSESDDFVRGLEVVEEPEVVSEPEDEEVEEPLSIAERFAIQSGFAFDEDSEVDQDDEADVNTSAWLSGTDERVEESDEESVEYPAQESVEESVEEMEKPVKELSQREHQIHIAQLSNWLAPDSDRFIESIFRGSPEAYEKAIAALSACSGWKPAASYIKEEIFDAFEVELTDPIAADFTDGMQSYFEEFKG